MKDHLVVPGHEIFRTLTPQHRASITDILKTPSWDTLESLLLPASRVYFEQVQRDLEEPKKAFDIRTGTFIRKLRERQAELMRVNPNTLYRIGPDVDREGATGYPALFEVLQTGEDKIRMWDGTTVTLAQSGPRWTEDKFSIPVYPIKYSEWVACQNFRYANAFRDQGIQLPYAGIGISVLMETTDGLIPLTRRGIETPVYPAMLYSPGGGPKPGQDSTEALLEEILEETGLRSGDHFDPKKLTMLALVSDTRFHNSDHQRPELVAHLPVKVSFRELERIQFDRARTKGLSETDVWRIDPLSANPDTLPDGILFHGNQFCPPTEAGLAHLVLFQLLQQTGDIDHSIGTTANMMRKMESYRREPYIPPISRLTALEPPVISNAS